MAWDPTQYLAFEQERMRPALDLLVRVALEAPRTVVDMGCGPGTVTKALKDRWPQAQVTGVDASPEMLARARDEAPDISWVEADLATWCPEAPADLLYSNAALHWLDDHETLFPRIFGHVAPGGFLAVQMPRNWQAPSHTCITETVLDGPWRAALEPLLRPSPSHAPGVYYDLLAPSATSLEFWETDYCQILEGDNPVLDFMKGSQLKRFLDALEEPQRADFEAAYGARVAAAYPKRADGKTLFPFRRLFILAGR